jgi:alpha-1,2-mannosyltransferase
MRAAAPRSGPQVDREAFVADLSYNDTAAHPPRPIFGLPLRRATVFARMIRTVTSPGLLRLVALAGAVGWLLAFVVHFSTLKSLTDRNGEPIGGDFISVYTAGRLVLEGRAADLYDLQLQQATQGRIVGSPDYRALCSFVNPPVVAAACAPLALLPYRLAYVIYTGLLLAAFLLAMRFLRPQMPALQQHWAAVVGLSFLFYPFAVTITGGQNTAVTFLLMSAGYAYLRRGQDSWAGLMLGLLFYKPQFALLFCLLLFVRRRFRCVLVAGALACAYYVVGAALCGIWWPLEMTRSLAVYWPLENRFNGLTSISLVGFCESVLSPTLFKPVGLTLSAAVTGVLLWAWRRANPRDASFAGVWALAVCGTVLVSPHTQWYDVGVVVLPVLLALNESLQAGQQISTNMRLALLAGFFLVPFYRYADVIGWQPVILLPLLTLLWLLNRRTILLLAPQPSRRAAVRAG